jgi:hypothetical protein
MVTFEEVYHYMLENPKALNTLSGNKFRDEILTRGNGQSAGNQVSKFIYWDPTLWVDPNLLRTIGILRDYT